MKKIIKVLLASTLLIAVLLVFGVFYIRASINRPNTQTTDPKEIVVEKGMSVREIAKVLYDQKLISSRTLFALYVRNQNIELQAGVYTIKPGLSLAETAKLLTLGVDDVKITIVEGLRSEEIAENFAEKLPNFNKENFMNAVRSQKLEGMLFPDTYYFAKEADDKVVLETMLKNFSKKTGELFEKPMEGLSKEQVLILASIVEREEANKKERPTVAGILVERFKNGEVLGVDATIQYAVGKPGDYWPKALTLDDLQIEGPYNTRKSAGLPPTPICNPGLSAIESVINYVNTPYKYYLHDSEGVIHYAKTLEEHNENIYKYLR